MSTKWVQSKLKIGDVDAVLCKKRAIEFGGRHAETERESGSCIKFITRHHLHHQHQQQQQRQQWKHNRANARPIVVDICVYYTGIFRIVSFILFKLFACSSHTLTLSLFIWACESHACAWVFGFILYCSIQICVTFEMNECSVNPGKKMYLNNSTQKQVLHR